jgi:Xaa-Pro aminopeptidase
VTESVAGSRAQRPLPGSQPFDAWEGRDVGRARSQIVGRPRPGAEFYDVDRIAALTIADGLVEFGLLRGSPADLVERGSVSLFFPHGVGHMLGLGVRDAGAALEGRAPRARGFVKLRVDLPLLTGYTMTIEPGVYFVPALLGDAELREQHRDVVDWDRAEAMLDFGGIRVEDNVLITDAGCDVLTDDVPLL